MKFNPSSHYLCYIIAQLKLHFKIKKWNSRFARQDGKETMTHAIVLEQLWMTRKVLLRDKYISQLFVLTCEALLIFWP